jgi:uncharacterized repeat protein (TIGR01451 family)
MTADFGYTNKSTLSDFVWWDVDSDGQQDAGEPGIPGVTVVLYQDNDNSGTVTVGDTPILTDTTDSSGLYEFSGLLPGNYVADIPNSEFAPGETLNGWSPSPQDVGPDATDSDGDANHEADTNLSLGEQDSTVDFGFTRNPDYVISKILNTVDPVPTGSPISFTIRITNTGNITITSLPLTDTYNAAFLQFVSSSPAQTSQQTGLTSPYSNTGRIVWANALTQTLAPGGVAQVVVNFTGLLDTTDSNNNNPDPNGRTINRAASTGPVVDPDGNGPLPPLPVPVPKEGQDDVQILNPTSVTIVDNSVSEENGVTLRWSTESETDVLGFNVWREADGQAVKLNDALILAVYSGQAQGSSYSFADGSAQTGVYYGYQLEIALVDGRTVTYELGGILAGAQKVYLPLVTR